MRVKGGDAHRKKWNRGFFLGSLVASAAQGWMLGSYVTGLQPGPLNLLFSALIAVTLPALYLLLGAGWLLMKAEGELFDKAIVWARRALLPMGVCLLLISVATPLVSEVIARRWFTLPNAIVLFPIPLSSVLIFAGLVWLLGKPEVIRRYSWTLFVGLLVLCVMATLGLAYSIYPDIILGRMDIWEAAASTDSLVFVLYGIAITLPAIIGYSIYVYRVFHGRATDLSYE